MLSNANRSKVPSVFMAEVRKQKKPREVCGKRFICNSKLNLFNRLKRALQRYGVNLWRIKRRRHQSTNQSIIQLINRS